MINPLKVASGGYLKKGTKAVLVIAVAGYLSFGGSPITSYASSNAIEKNKGTGGEDEKYIFEQLQRNEEEEIMIIIKMFVQCRGL